MQQTVTISAASSDYLAALHREAQRVAALRDAVYTTLLREHGIPGPAALVSLDGTALVIDVPDGETV